MRKRIKSAVALVGLAVCVTACGGSGDAEPAAAKSTDPNTVVLIAEAGNKVTYGEVVKQYRESAKKDTDPTCEQMLAQAKVLVPKTKYPEGEALWLKACKEGEGK